MTTPTDAELRALAEKALVAENAQKPSGEFYSDPEIGAGELMVGYKGGPAEMYPAMAAMYRWHTEVLPSTVLALLDGKAAAEREVERLRAQNKESGDAWSKKYGDLEHELASINRARRYASELVGEHVDPESRIVFNSLSAIGRQAIADLKRRMERAESEWHIVNSAKYHAEQEAEALRTSLTRAEAERDRYKALYDAERAALEAKFRAALPAQPKEGERG